LSYLVRVRRTAELDIAEAQLWYETQSEGLGAGFHAEVLRILDRLADTPLIYAVKLS
jgi:hypothetical protein